MVLERFYPTDTDKTSLDGLTGSVGFRLLDVDLTTLCFVQQGY